MGYILKKEKKRKKDMKVGGKHGEESWRGKGMNIIKTHYIHVLLGFLLQFGEKGVCLPYTSIL